MTSKQQEHPYTEKMFRYLEKHFVGKYRVLAHYDEVAEDFPREDNGAIDESFDDQYIPCAKGRIIGTYFDDEREILAWYTDSASQGRNVYKELQAKYPKMFMSIDDCDSSDYFIYFKAADISKIATVVKPRTSGAKIHPYDLKNLPKPEYTIPEAEEEAFKEIVKDLSRTDKMFFVRDACIAFDEVIQKKKGKRFHIEEKRKESRLKPKAFISYIGMWPEFLEFCKKRIEETNA